MPDQETLWICVAPTGILAHIGRMKDPTARQIRAAMAMAGISQVQLADAIGRDDRTIRNLLDGRNVHRSTMDAVLAEFRARGIIWIDGPEIEGVGMRPEP